jgi:4-amino-4-deoxy-L-arabinose transferase-like glycosyltransferase
MTPKAASPALVSRQAATRLPRAALLLFCAAYVLPGLFGRDPWRSADATAFGFMANLADGSASWLAPTIGGVPADGALLPYWIGALSIMALGDLLGAPLAARLPFALVMLGVLSLTWYSCYHLARTEAAQPLPFAFGGEADPIDYSRAVADGAVLALIATLGLLQLGHETTPELVQLGAVAAVLYALAACPFRGPGPRIAIVLGLLALAASAAPTIALALGLAGSLVCQRSAYEPTRRFVPWVVGATLAAAVLSTALDVWAWRAQAIDSLDDLVRTGRLFAWFTWPTLPLAAWTLWRWRSHWLKRHISVPLTCAAVGVAAGLVLGGYDRALLLALPALAVLAAFALPTLRRSAAAAIDWFSVFFFSVCAIVVWVVYVAMQTGWPSAPANNVRRLAPGFEPSFSWIALLAAAAATLAWLGLVHWRTGRQRHPLWKSMVLPASGVALCWTLLMTLWLPLLDHARSFRPLVDRLQPHLADSTCVMAEGTPRALQASLEHFSRLEVVAGPTSPRKPACDVRLLWLTRVQPDPPAAPGWASVATERHPSDRDNRVVIWRRTTRP